MIHTPGFGGFMLRLRLTLLAGFVVLACEEPPPQGPSDPTYQNGYAQTTSDPRPPVTYTPLATATATGTATATATDPLQPPVEIQTTPVPLGVQTLPPPLPTTTAVPTPTTTAMAMAIPGKAAFVCVNDNMCGLGRCNTPYGKCAYPCRTSDADCKAGSVCTKSGICLPRAVAGLSM
jgi:hypothetical protein